MFEIKKNNRVNELIAITKSNSGVSGPVLAKAHMELGGLLAEEFTGFDPKDITIVAVLRGGIFFAEGMYFKLGCKFQTYDPKKDTFVRPDTKYVILADSVINTGKTILPIWAPDMIVASCVTNRKVVPVFDKQLYTIRVSGNSFIGAEVSKQTGDKGPDTTMRLFNLI